jgi:phosphohistidine phosphatase
MSGSLQLYLLRHGRADRDRYDGDDDRLRPLTADGVLRLEQQGRFLARAGLKPDLVLTSPLLRARQTAEIVARRLGAMKRLREEPRLDPDFDVERLAGILAEADDDCRQLMLVGHEPSFSAVIAGITGGSLVVCKKGSLARVDLPARRKPAGALAWLLPPRAMLT